ncbi:glycerol-3-phosphate dehydrogenase/oxidase [Kribbella sandramycini]|uniref:Glycerol-3-phosphate dehydrogenase n=1 Tax=Kribbella sandramycini TaxID=60450 RepID=A0A7Y4L038_9ACTN|nr:glycerol-3-phosphate dehydrogenase/oxidase [Kribbella sandramycini]MBB6565578.1 glycerol-3-phosphate dehydrogenase [Kribbella sandramycini]NOL41842.1 glycerol-3-phosphate dehydrogenase/oxidase [Kribbella sandramycini]
MISLGNAALNAARRTRELEWLSTAGKVDVLVIGGGVTGAGVALDAAARGLTVALVEKHDLAFGTSRWSSKLVHGGLRYLASGHVGIAYESAVERGILMKTTAPHLVHPVPQLAPWLPQAKASEAALVRGAFLGGDVLRTFARTSGDYLPRSRRVGAAEILRYAPTLRPEGMRGGFLTWDGQLYDDARLVIAIARTAAQYGARVLTRVAATEVTGQGAVLVDQLTGQRLQVDASVVINAAGIWAGQVAEGIKLRPSRGTHLVFPQSAFGGLSAVLTVPVPGQLRRVVMAIPAPDDRVYVGLTDEDAPGPVSDVPRATDAEIDFLLDTINRAVQVPLTRADLLGTYAGLRPLLDTGHHTGKTADISRRHAVITGPDGLVTIVGGKLTTYRRMAQDALDTALAQSTLSTRRPCLTHRIPLVGAADRVRLAAVAAPTRFVRRYGVEAPQVIDGPASWLEPIAPGLRTTFAELLFAVRHEGALDADDVLDRRTRIGLSAADRELALPAVREAFATV